MSLLNFWFLLSLTTISANLLINPTQPRVAESNGVSYRLSGTATPVSYAVSLEFGANIFSGDDTAFYGEVLITFRVNQATDVIEINSGVSHSSITIYGIDPAENLTQSATLNSTTAILQITTAQILTNNTVYSMIIEFTGNVETVAMSGPYRSSYLDESNQTKYLISTQFQPTYARNAFPSFDEPEYKANFQFVFTYPAGLTVLFNTRPSTTNTNDTYTTTEFLETVSMPTYLIAFVLSDFSCSGGEEIREGVPHEVCSRVQSSDQRNLSNFYSPAIMRVLEDATGLAFSRGSVNKMHQVAVPDFSAGAMENWGLVTYREAYLLYDEIESSNTNKQQVLTIIAHEFAHMWFGNLITTKWWNTLFLNEGFASYFEYFAIAMLEELEVTQSWELSKQFIVDQQQSVFTADASLSSIALSSQASTPTEIWGKFSSISYLKGASVIRMVHNFLGSSNFYSGIRDYLSNNQYQATQPWNLWASLQKSVPENTIPYGLTLEQIMDNWVNISGYPVISVNASGDDVLITQKRFLYNETDTTTWFVPISYTLSSDLSQFTNVSVKEWLPQGNYILTLKGVLNGSNWIILNNQESAYYRVNYDTILWSRIRIVLSENHTIIDVLNRAQIVDDALNLARAGQLSYREAFQILEYLKKETEYYPLVSALTGLDYVQRMVGQTSTVGQQLQQLQLELLAAAKNDVSFATDTETSHILSLKVALVLARLCRLGETSCVADATSIYRSHVVNRTSVNRNLKSVVYCNGLRYSDDITRDWEFLWNKFQTTNLATEQVTILSALGCTKDTTYLNYYLSQSLNETSKIRHQDISRVWSSVVTSNPEGVGVALEFYFNKSEEIRTRFESTVSVISTIAGRLTTDQEVQQLEAFLNSTDLHDSVKSAAAAALSGARSNLDWAHVMRPQIEEHLPPVSTGGVAERNFLSILTLAAVLVVVSVLR